MFQPELCFERYPSFLLFGWERDDGDFECLAALNGDQIEDWRSWNYLVEQTYVALTYALDNEVIVLEREELGSVLSPYDPNEQQRVKVLTGNEEDI